MNIYCIQVRGTVDVADLNGMSPHQMTCIRVEPAETLFSIRTDQSGMIGMLRHLHNLGIEILSVNEQAQTPAQEMKRNE